MPVTALRVPLERITDPAVRRIGERILKGDRLSQSDGIALFESTDLTGVGLLADEVNRHKHGDIVTFAAKWDVPPPVVPASGSSCIGHLARRVTGQY